MFARNPAILSNITSIRLSNIVIPTEPLGSLPTTIARPLPRTRIITDATTPITPIVPAVATGIGRSGIGDVLSRRPLKLFPAPMNANAKRTPKTYSVRVGIFSTASSTYSFFLVALMTSRVNPRVI